MRYGRQVKPPKRLIDMCLALIYQRKGFKPKSKYDSGQGKKDKVASKTLNNQFAMAMKWNRVIYFRHSPDLSAMNAWMEQQTNPEHNTINEWHPLALAAQSIASNNPTWE